MLNHPTSKKLIERLKQSLDREIKELTEGKQKLVIAQKYGDAGIFAYIVMELEQLKERKSILVQEQKFELASRMRDYEKSILDVIEFKS